MLIPKAERRIEQYVHFLEKNAYQERARLEFEVYETAETLRAPPKDARWQKIAAPYPYGKEWNYFWFRASFAAPAAKGPLFLNVTPNSDSLVFIDEKPYGAFNPFHQKLRVDGDKTDGKTHTLHIEAYGGHRFPGCHPFEGAQVMFALSRQLPAYPNIFGGGAVVERNETIYSLYYDTRALYELAQTLPPDSLRKAKIIKGLYDALMGIRFTSEGQALEDEARAAARRIAPLLAAKNSETTPEIFLIGHAHIDHAWLWHIGETEHKIARTYLNMVRFAREYPEFVFIQSQPCQLEIMRSEYPEVFAQVKEAAKNGNWEANGGMWVEADCNISGGESLIRQFLVGKTASREMLGTEHDADTLWLPDVFGYAAALPQILAGCGIKYFVTSKINWNDTTRFPYDTFIWRGIDGSGIKTHYLASKTQGYNGRVSPASLVETWHEIQHKELQDQAVKSVGEGDGGGGTAREDLEMARRLVNLEGAPRASWKKVSAALDAIFSAHDRWPEWKGELYLELHRGTYTTQARTKQYNRRLEFALRNAEWLAFLAGERAYSAELLAAWKKVLTNQFHDIIPGSSIRRVYAEAEAVYKKTQADVVALAGKFRQRILEKSGAGTAVFNDLSWQRSDPLVCPAEQLEGAAALKSADGTVYPIQRYTGLDGEKLALCSPKLGAMGWNAFSLVAGNGDSSGGRFKWADNVLETPFYRALFDEYGRIKSLVAHNDGREMVAGGGCFNRFISACDIPVLWEAWDVDSDWTLYAREETDLLSTEVAAEGPECFRLRRKYRIGSSSTLTQDTVFYAKEPRIDFDTRVEWNERRTLLKTAFDTAIDAGEVRCEVQYGHLFRNTHRNLPHDRAKFEICAHKWICLEEAGAGIALLNDCKYGHDVEGGRMRLTLLRSPVAPDPEADAGTHRFVYSLLPFTGSFASSRVIESGYELNDPAVIETASAKSGGPAFTEAAYSLCSLDNNAVIIESAKNPQSAGDGAEQSVVLRLYESLGGRAVAALTLARPASAVFQTDMLEENPRPVSFKGNEIPLEFHPFEIKTLLVRFADE
jgi:alpha-mannosidase